jgi:hypothetical protein
MSLKVAQQIKLNQTNRNKKQNIMAKQTESTETAKTKSNAITKIEEIEMPDAFGEIEDGVITNSLLELRNDCSALGQWKFGDSDFIGKAIKFNLLSWQRTFGCFGKGAPQEWIQVSFTPSPDETKLMQNLTYATYIKTKSKDEWETLIWKIKSEKKNVRLGTFTAELVSESNDLGSFSKIKWGWESAKPEQANHFAMIADFIKTNPPLVPSMPPTMLIVPKDADAELKAEIKEEVIKRADKRKALTATQ